VAAALAACGRRLQLFWNHHEFSRGKRAGSSPVQLAGVPDAPSLSEALDQVLGSQPSATGQPVKPVLSDRQGSIPWPRSSAMNHPFISVAIVTDYRLRVSQLATPRMTTAAPRIASRARVWANDSPKGPG
jgi:hypothetical protein